MITAYIGLGSNLDEPLQQLLQAVRAIGLMENTHISKTSSVFRTRAMGPEGQDDYLNAVIELQTGLAPLDLLHALQAIELQQGRQRKGERWGARTLDLDVLLYGQQVIESDELTVPHPGMHERGFVLHPLYELNTRIEIPGKGQIDALLKHELVGEVLQKLDISL